jgi:hypothetical protein
VNGETVGIGRDDEDRHAPVPGSANFYEQWCFEFVSPGADGEPAAEAGYASLVLVSSIRTAWYWSAIVRPGHDVVVATDLAIPMPRRRLEIRGSGLWADHVCETPLEHWTIGNEAMGLAVSDPGELLGRARGEIVPLGFDLEWEATGAPSPGVVGAPGGGTSTGYEIAAAVHGLVLVGDRQVDVDGLGRWWHRWGDIDWAAVPAGSHSAESGPSPAPVALTQLFPAARLEPVTASYGWRWGSHRL